MDRLAGCEIDSAVRPTLRPLPPSAMAACPSKVTVHREPNQAPRSRRTTARRRMFRQSADDAKSSYRPVLTASLSLRENIRDSSAFGRRTYPSSSSGPCATAAAPRHRRLATTHCADGRVARTQRSRQPKIRRPISGHQFHSLCHRTPRRSPCRANDSPPYNWQCARDDAAPQSCTRYGDASAIFVLV